MDFRPVAGFETAVGVDPEVVWGDEGGGFFEELGHFFDGGDARGVDVPDAGADFVRITVAGEGVEEFHVGSGGFDGDDVGIELADGFDDVVEFGVAHVGVDLGGIGDG